MPDQAAPPAPPINPVLPPGVEFVSRLERQNQINANTPLQPPDPTMDAPPELYQDDGASARALEQARARDLQTANARQGAQPANADQQQQSDQPAANLRRRGGQSQQAQQRRAQDWEALRAKADEAATLRAEVERLKAGLPGNLNPDGTTQTAAQQQSTYDIAADPRYKALQAERDTFYEEIKHVRVEADPEFRAKFDAKREAALRVARSVAGAAADDIARILAINDPDLRASQLAERIKDFGEGSKHKIMAANAALAAIDVEREIEVTTRKATWDITQKQRQQQQAAQRQQHASVLDRDFNDVLAKWDKMPLFEIADKGRAIADARRIFSGESDGPALAEASLKASLFNDVLSMATQAYKEIDALRSSLARYGASMPGADYGNSQGSYAQADQPISSTTLDHSFASRLESVRAADRQRQSWGQ